MSADRRIAEASGGHGLAVTCDRSGRILAVLDNRLETDTRPEPGHMLSEIIEEASRDKLNSLLDATCVSGSAFDWELNVKGPAGTNTVIGAGVCQGEALFVILAATKGDAAKMLEQFVAVNNELVNTIRTLQKRLSITADPPQDQAGDFGELMRLNNDLVNLQREMAKKNAELTQSRRLVQSIVDTTPDVIYIFNLRSERNTYTNRGYERMLGYTAEEMRDLEGRFYADLLHPDDASARERHLKHLARAADGQAVDWEYRARTADGQWVWFRSRETVFERDSDGTPIEILGSAQDITARRAAEERLVQLAIIDELTGVYNRRGLETLSHQLVAQAERTETSVGVVFADLDGLKAINDSL
ncbi:MAG: PAS domain-containing protein, partial [Coriobacteriia bacterium]|nr:PAS domain-containing protein [Coriobacteriia bacterium]